MPKRFYVAWVFVVVLAITIPIVVPYLIWSTYEPLEDRSQLSAADWTAHSARGNARYARVLPNSVSVAPCDSGPGLDSNGFSALVTFRGAYGLPIATIDYDCSNAYPVRADGRNTPPLSLEPWTVLSAGALIVGGLLAYVPFWRLEKRVRSGEASSGWFVDRPVQG